MRYDLAIIGGGAGAFAAAIKANELGAKTVLINDGLPLGGTCVNVGCVPSKTLLHAAELLHTAKHHDIPGLELEVKTADYGAIVADELALVERLRAEKYEQVLAGLDNLTFMQGRAVFVSPDTVRVGDQQVQAFKFIIATGSTASVPDIEGLAEAGYITHVEAMSLKTIPKRLAVVGAGPLGLELAQLYARFGSHVTILQKADSIMPEAEPELAAHLEELLEKEGIGIKTGVHITKVASEVDAKTVFYQDGTGEQRVDADEILLAAGKTPNTADLQLKNAGIETNAGRAVKVARYLQTSQPHIFAVGDVADLPLRLETTAGKEGTYAVLNVLSGSTKAIDYHAVPYTVFTDPGLVSVGYTEAQQMDELGVCACRTLSFEVLPKGLITKRTEGMIKIAIHPKTKVIMGVHILAPNAGDLIAQAMVLIKNQNTIDDLEDMLPVFPTFSEAIKLAALSFTRDVSKMSCCV